MSKPIFPGKWVQPANQEVRDELEEKLGLTQADEPYWVSDMFPSIPMSPRGEPDILLPDSMSSHYAIYTSDLKREEEGFGHYISIQKMTHWATTRLFRAFRQALPSRVRDVLDFTTVQDERGRYLLFPDHLFKYR